MSTIDAAVAAPTTTVAGTVVVLLAAGAGTRFEGTTHKLLAPLGGSSIVEHALMAALAADVGPVIVVAGAVDLPASVSTHPTVSVVHNDRWADGQATSLAAGIAAAERLGADAVVVGLGDQPFVAADAWRTVAASIAPIAIATYDGRPRNPVRLHRSVWPLLPVAGDEGARSLARMRPDLVERVPCAGSPADIDTLADLNDAEDHQQWQSRSSTNSP